MRGRGDRLARTAAARHVGDGKTLHRRLALVEEAARINRGNPAAAVYLRDLCEILQRGRSEDDEVNERSREVLGAEEEIT